MKKVFFKSLSIFLALLMLNIPGFAMSMKASSSMTTDEIQAVSEFNDADVYAAFADLNQLDQYLQTNTTVSYADVAKENSSILSGVSSTSSLPLTAPADGEKALGIPSFLWGCVFSWVGVLVVYLLTDKDKEQTKKALWGCGVGALVYIVYYVVVVAAVSTSTTY